LNGALSCALAGNQAPMAQSSPSNGRIRRKRSGFMFIPDISQFRISFGLSHSADHAAAWPSEVSPGAINRKMLERSRCAWKDAQRLVQIGFAQPAPLTHKEGEMLEDSPVSWLPNG